MNDAAMVMNPSVSKVQWIPEIIPSGPGRWSPPRYRPARSEETATPKLIDICWTVLEMLLPELASASGRSAITSVFMLVNCMEDPKPRMKARATISHGDSVCWLTDAPSPGLSRRKMNDAAMVMNPSVSKVQWIPEIIPSGPGRWSPPRYRPARSEETATPKLIDICWTVLEMLLPELASASGRSAITSVFMLVNCMEDPKPRMKARPTISHGDTP